MESTTVSHAARYPLEWSDLAAAAQLLASGRTGTVTLEFVARDLPDGCPYLVAAGLEASLEMLQYLRLNESDLEWLKQSPLAASLPSNALAQLLQLQFSGDVEALPEGTLVFPGEPILRVRASAPQAYVLSSALRSAISFQTATATYASRLCQAALGKAVYDASGSAVGTGDLALQIARAAFLGGFVGCSHPLALRQHHVPTLHAMPLDVFRRGLPADHLQKLLPHLSSQLVLMVDEEEPLVAVEEVAKRGLQKGQLAIPGTPALEVLQTARKILNRSDAEGVQLLAHGRFDEHSIRHLMDRMAPVHGFIVEGLARRVSGSLVVDAHLVGWDALGKTQPIGRTLLGMTVPVGQKAVYRKREAGAFTEDIVQPHRNPAPKGFMPLMVPVMQNGRRCTASPSLAESRVLCASQIQTLHESVLSGERPYPVQMAGFDEVQRPTPVESEPMAGPAPAAATKPGSNPADIFAGLDDSADFGFVSRAFETVMRERFGMEEAPKSVEAAPPTPPPPIARTPVTKPPVPPPAKAARVPEVIASSPAVSEPAPGAPPRWEPPASPAPKVAPEPPVSAPASRELAPLSPPTPERPAPTKASETAHFGNSTPEVSAPASPLLEAAARLRKTRIGGDASAPATAPPAAKEPSSTESRKGSVDPLLAAASRLRAVQGGTTNEPAPVAPSVESSLESSAQPAESVSPSSTTGKDYSGEHDGGREDALAGAAARLKALRG